jgi:hypothetical protein
MTAFSAEAKSAVASWYSTIFGPHFKLQLPLNSSGRKLIGVAGLNSLLSTIMALCPLFAVFGLI